MTTHEGATILVTGGCGYIGTHTIVCLLEQGYDVVIVDNLVNASSVSLDRVAEIANLDDEARKKRLVFHQVDLCDKEALRKVFESSPTFQACIHFAGLKVSEYYIVTGSFVYEPDRKPSGSMFPISVLICIVTILTILPGCWRKHKGASQVLPQQFNWNLFPFGIDGSIQLPCYCFLVFCNGLWSRRQNAYNRIDSCRCWDYECVWSY